MSHEPHQAILLPGGIMPAALAYPDLVRAFVERADARYKELELYDGEEPPDDYSLETEVDGVVRMADAAGFDQFHLVGYSGSGAACLAMCATHGSRLLSVTVTEPDWDPNWVGDQRSPEEEALWKGLSDSVSLPDDQMVQTVAQLLLGPGVKPPPRPEGPTPPWMAKRPAGLRAFDRAFAAAKVDIDAMRAFDRPVLFVLGGRSNQTIFRAMAGGLARILPDFALVVYDERHHFDPPHRAEPERFASSLVALWERASA